MLALAAVALTSCSEGKYWNEASNIGEAVAFDKPNETVVIPDADEMPTFYDVPINRTVAGPEETFAVTFTDKSKGILSAPAEITFKAGEYTALYRISIDAAQIVKGVKYKAVIGLEQPEDVKIQVKPENLKLNFTIEHELILQWASAGTATVYSKWADLDADSAVEIPVDIATNYPDPKYVVYRLVSPYWYMEPKYADEGYDILFMLYAGSRMTPYGLYEDFQPIGEAQKDDAGKIQEFYLGSTAKYKASFTKNSRGLYNLTAYMFYAAQGEDAVEANMTAYAEESLRFTLNLNK